MLSAPCTCCSSFCEISDTAGRCPSKVEVVGEIIGTRVCLNRQAGPGPGRALPGRAAAAAGAEHICRLHGGTMLETCVCLIRQAGPGPGRALPGRAARAAGAERGARAGRAARRSGPPRAARRRADAREPGGRRPGGHVNIPVEPSAAPPGEPLAARRSCPTPLVCAVRHSRAMALSTCCTPSLHFRFRSARVHIDGYPVVLSIL